MENYQKLIRKFADRPGLMEMATEAEPLIEIFCTAYDLELKDVKVSTEDEKKTQPLYVFNNDLGGYHIEAIKESLGDKGILFGGI